MPRALPWTSDQDASLTALLDQRGSTLRKAAQQLGVSRSFAQRRAKLLHKQSVRSIGQAVDDSLACGHASRSAVLTQDR